MQEKRAPYQYYLLPLLLITGGVSIGLIVSGVLLLGPIPAFQWAESWAVYGLSSLALISCIAGVLGLLIPQLSTYLPSIGHFLTFLTLILFASLSLDHQWQVYFLILTVVLYLIQGFAGDSWLSLIIGLAICVLFLFAIRESEPINRIAQQHFGVFAFLTLLNQGLIQLRLYWYPSTIQISGDLFGQSHILDQLGQGIVLIEPELQKILYANAEATHLLQRFQLSVHVSASRLFEKLNIDPSFVASFVANEELHSQHERLVPPAPVHDQALSVRLSLLELSGNRVLQVSLQDVSQQWQQGRSLQKTLAFNHTLIQHLPDVLLTLDPFGIVKATHIPANYQYFNFLQTYHGKQLTEIAEALLPDSFSRQELDQKWRLTNQEGTFQDLSFQVSNGAEPYFIECRLIPRAKHEGSFCIWRDISIRQHASQALQSSEQRYRSLVENMEDGLFLTDEELIVKFVNPQLCHHLQQPEEAFYEMPLAELFRDHSANNPDFIQALTQAGSLEKMEYRFEGPAGEVFWFLVSCSPYINGEGEKEGLIGIVTDITTRKQIEIQLQQKNHELDTFVYNASHDLRGPLASIIGLTNIAQEEIDEQKALGYFSMINRSTKRLDGVLSDLIEVTRLNKAQVVLEPIDLTSFIQEIIDSLGHMPQSDTMVFGLDVQFSSPISSDKKLLTSILQNLIVNSIAYHNPKANPPTVQITVWQGPYRIQCEIKDNGIGIPPRILPRIFEMFYRGNTHSKGSGLGLYIVKNALAKLGGDISVVSEEKIGTTFTFYIPKSEISADSEKALSTASPVR